MEKLVERNTKPLEKLLASIINVLFVGIIAFPSVFFTKDITILKEIYVSLFFLYNVIILLINKNRCLGMMALNMHWKPPYRTKNHLIFVFLYTMSFATAFIWIVFPFDLLIFNLLFIQLPTVILKKTTFHGYLSGGLSTLRFVKK
jgi:hypothetical protein